MSWETHHAIIVTSFDKSLIASAIDAATGLGLLCIGPSNPAVNGFTTMLVCPDGSKDGWEKSDKADGWRASFKRWLNDRRHSDGSNSLTWVEVEFDSREAEVIDQVGAHRALGES